MYIYLIYLISPVLLKGFFSLLTRGREIKRDGVNKLYLYIMSFIMFFFYAFRNKKLGAGDGVVYFTNWENIAKLDITDFPTIFSYDLEYGYLLYVFIQNF